MRKEIPAPADVKRILQRVDDPDLGCNIVDLGLIYGIRIHKKGRVIRVIMTLTSMGCPRGPEILSHIKTEIKQAFPRFRLTIDIVWEPAWNAGMMSEVGRAHLGL